MRGASIALLLATAGCGSCSKRDATDPAGDAAAPDATSSAAADAGAVNVTVLPTEAVERQLNPDKLPAYTGATGTIEGTIFLRGDRAPETPVDGRACSDASTIFGRAFREGEPASDGGPRWLADAVVVVTGYSGFWLPEREEAEELTIEGCAFSRRTVTMTFGQRLEVKNRSKELWTPKLEPDSSPLVTMAMPNGEPAKLHPKKPGRYRVTDFDRKWASVDLFAFLHPLHTTSGVQGTYRIEGVPVGKVTVSTMHPKIPGTEASQEIEVREGAVHRVELTLEHVLPAPRGRDAGTAPLRLR